MKQRRKNGNDKILRFFLHIPASTADVSTVNPKEIEALLANGVITLFIKGNPVFSNEPRSLPTNTPDCIILDNGVFNNLISVNDFFGNSIRRFSTCLLVNDNLWGKLISPLQTIFDDNRETNPVLFIYLFICRLSFIKLWIW